jgi:hypothetical protein
MKTFPPCYDVFWVARFLEGASTTTRSRNQGCQSADGRAKQWSCKFINKFRKTTMRRSKYQGGQVEKHGPEHNRGRSSKLAKIRTADPGIGRTAPISARARKQSKVAGRKGSDRPGDGALYTSSMAILRLRRSLKLTAQHRDRDDPRTCHPSCLRN